MTTKNDYYLDITNEVCPITFVRTKLQLEKMNHGERLEVHLCAGEPLENVPQSVKEMGDIIHSCDPIRSENGKDIYRLIIEKK